MAASVDAAHAPDADTWDHVVRATAHCGQLEAAALLMRLCREHAHDPELLARTGGVRSGKRGLTLLMVAVERCDVARAAEIVGAAPTPASRSQLLACVNSKDQTALHMACSPKREDEGAALALLELLLGAGADRDCQPIHLAAEWSVRLVQRLVAAGASIDGDLAGNSTLRCAAAAGTARSVRMIPALVALGARETDGNDAMQDFAYCSVKGAPPPSDEEVRAALTALVSVGCSLTEPDEEDGMTPMDTAAHGNNAPVVAALLAMGVAATTQSLVHAVTHPDIVRMLLAAGAPPGVATTVTPLMAAASFWVLESVRLLLAAGASVHDSDEHGHTALVHALNCFFVTTLDDVPHVVEELLVAGADVAARDNDGNTPLHVLATVHASQPWAATVARLLLASDAAAAAAVNTAGETHAQRVPAGAARAGELYTLLLAPAEA
jgi:ankyrin repeat protein